MALGLPCFVTTISPQIRCVNLFTDGGALTPTDPDTRLASWGVVAADTGSMEFQPISCGILPRGHQTVLRAEITAALSAVKFALTTGKPFRLWIDNAEVVRLAVWLHHPTPVTTQTTDNDLCSDAAEWIRRTAHMCKGIVKVTSHQILDEVTGNEAAFPLQQQLYMNIQTKEIFTVNLLRSTSPIKLSKILFIPPSLRWDTSLRCPTCLGS